MSRIIPVFSAVIMTIACAAPVLGEDYRLGVQDRLALNAYGYPNVSGEFVVGPNGVIRVPLIGNIEAEGRSLDEITVLITEALQTKEGLIERPDVTVQIVEFRPFFVVGNVEKPGRYPYEPGLTVLKALSTAGGTYRPADPEALRLTRDAVNADGTIKTLQISAVQLRLRITRLRAEIEGKDEFTPQLSREDARSEMVRNFVLQEQMILSAKRKLLHGQVAALEKLSQVYKAEVTSLRERVRLKKISVEAAQKRFERDVDLAKRGVTSNSSVLERERLLADTRAEEEELHTLVLRAEQGVTQSDQSLRSLLDGRQRDNVQELHDTEVELYQCLEKIRTAQELLYEASVAAPGAFTQSSTSRQHGLSYRIVRMEDGKAVTINGVETTPIQPGDVVEVFSDKHLGYTASALQSQ